MISGKGIVFYKSLRRISFDTWNWWRNVQRSPRNRIIDQIVRNEPVAVEGILRNTEITSDHMTPEIKLFLLTPNCPLYHAPFANDSSTRVVDGSFSDPFWSIYWPGGQALTRFIFDEKEKLFPATKEHGISVLDIGAGCGASAIAAKLVGAKRVVANDIDRDACVAISMNAILNNVDIEVSRENLLNRLPEKWCDVIFIGDMLYDEGIAEILIPWLERSSKRGTRIYLGDPGRHGLTSDLQKRLRLLREYSLPENVQRENHGYDKAGVWEFLSF